MTESHRLGSIIIPSKTPLFFKCRIIRVPSLESSSREWKRRPRKVLLTLGIRRSLVDSCLDCRAHEVTIVNHNRKEFWLLHPRCASEHCHGEWVTRPRSLRSVFVDFPATFLPRGSRNFFICWTTMVFKSICHKLHTFFICSCSRPSWYWVIVYAHTITTITISLTGNRTTAHCELTTNFCHSTGFLWNFGRVKF